MKYLELLSYLIEWFTAFSDEPITEETKIVSLDVTSLDVVDLIMDLEGELNADINEEWFIDLTEGITIKMLAERLAKNLSIE